MRVYSGRLDLVLMHPERSARHHARHRNRRSVTGRAGARAQHASAAPSMHASCRIGEARTFNTMPICSSGLRSGRGDSIIPRSTVIPPKNAGPIRLAPDAAQALEACALLRSGGSGRRTGVVACTQVCSAYCMMVLWRAAARDCALRMCVCVCVCDVRVRVCVTCVCDVCVCVCVCVMCAVRVCVTCVRV